MADERPTRPAAHKDPVPPSPPAPTPWRTEGLPHRDPPAHGQKPDRPRINWVKLVIQLAVAYLVIFLIFSFQDSASKPTAVSYTEFAKEVQAGNVAHIYAKGDTIQGTLKAERPVPGEDKSVYSQFSTERPTFARDDLLKELTDHGGEVRAKPVVQERGMLFNLLVSFAPLVLIFGFYYWMMRRQTSAMGNMFGGKGKKPVDPETVRVSFNDVAGIDEVEDQITEVVDFLGNPDKYRRLGARAPKGVLLAGAPGTGKTLLARATAGEAGVPFFSASASEFIEMIVGVGAQRVRQLFEEARKVAPSIIFIDEIDTIGRARGGAMSMGGHDEREQTLNQILTEMDGFSGSEGVVVMAATNRPEILDPALLRPGRFDRTIQVSAPDAKGRAQILAVHVRQVPLLADVDLEALARMTPGMTGADLANLVNEAALLAAKTGSDAVTMFHFTEALEKVQLGAARNVVMPPEERRRTAYHEAGHALLGMLQPGADPVRKISIIPRGRALGVTLSTPEGDRYGYDEAYLRGRIIGALGGMAAESSVFGVVTTGAESDLEQVTGIARQMVGRWGMSDKIGPVQVLPREGDPRQLGVSEEQLAAVDNEVRRIVDDCFDEAKRKLVEHRGQLDAIVAELLEHETLDETEAYAAAGISRRTSTVTHSP